MSPTYIPPEIGSRLARASIRVVELEGRLDQLTHSLKHHEKELAQTRARLEETQTKLHAIYGSYGWKLLKLYYRVRNFLLPPGTIRRRLVVRVVKAPLQKLKTLLKSGPPAAKALTPVQLPPTCPHAPLGLEEKPALSSTEQRYARWIENNEPGAAELTRQRATRFLKEPRISVLVDAGSSAGKYLIETLKSVRSQTYPHWEICLIGHEAPDPWLGHVLEESGIDAARIHAVSRPSASSVADGYRAGLAAAKGEFLTVLRPGDTLAPFAFFEIVQAVNRHEAADFLYSDEDCLSDPGDARAEPCFKPAWSPDTLRSHNYIGDLVVLSRALVESVGGVPPEWTPYDLVLRASERAREITHLPRVLYHRRTPRDDGASGAADRKSLQDHLARQKIAATVEDGLKPGTYRVTHSLPARPLVSIVIPNKDRVDMLARCVESIRQSTYSRHDIVVVENSSRQPETFAYYRSLDRDPAVQVVRWDKPFNYAALNNFAVERCAGEVLLFLNNDMQVITPSWLESMLEHGLRSQVGAVGAMLLYPDDTVQHAGMVLVRKFGPQHVHRFAPRDSAGYGKRLATVQNVSAVTGACLMMRKEVFTEAGGFDERLAVTYNDIDLCLQLRRKGYLVVWTPFAQLYHYESVSRDYYDQHVQDHELFVEKWRDVFENGDPYFSPHLVLDDWQCTVRI
jgi:GT2 family glycosyltransferase